MAKILVAEDDQAIARKVSDWLKFDQHAVDAVDNGVDALHQLKFYNYELVILDWNLPGMEGVEVCRRIRAIGAKIPVLFLTANDKIQCKEEGFASGADDYLTKPFDVRELAMRVRALLRRPANLQPNTLCVGNVSIDASGHIVTVDGERVHLTPKEFVILEYLMRNDGQVFDAQSILDRVWSSESEVMPQSLRPYIARLRSKLERNGKCILQNVHGVGYKVEGFD